MVISRMRFWFGR